jgi:hypothetical protein
MLKFLGEVHFIGHIERNLTLLLKIVHRLLDELHKVERQSVKLSEMVYFVPNNILFWVLLY